MKLQHPWFDWVALPLLLLVFSGLSFTAAVQESVTVDEFRHLSTGVYYWQSGDFAFDNATPPFWKLALSLPAQVAGAAASPPPAVDAMYSGWSPWLMATDFMRNNAHSYTSFLNYARLVNIAGACACIAYVYRRSRKRFGSYAAIYGVAFLAFSPTLLAHSHYATTDVISCLTLTVLVFLLIDFIRRPGWFLLGMISLLLGLSLLSKFTATLVLLPFFIVIAVGSQKLAETLFKKVTRPPAPWIQTLATCMLSLLMALIVMLLVFNVQYGFKGSGYRLMDIDVQSKSLQMLRMTSLGQIPLPVPKSLIEGFDHQKADSDYAEFPSYFMNQWSEGGFWHYYLGAFGLKETVPFVLMLILVLTVKIRSQTVSLSRSELALLWFVPGSLLFVLSFLNRLDVGVRYLLPAYPFLCYFYSQLFADRFEQKRFRVILLALLMLHCLSVIRIAPHYTAYFNEIGGGPHNGYRYLVDSNLDWGQDLIGLKQYMQKTGIEKIQLAYFGHALPEFYGINFDPLLDTPHPGYVAVSASLLQGQPYLLTYLTPPYPVDFDHYRFMRNYEPIAQIGYSIMIYHVTEISQ